MPFRNFVITLPPNPTRVVGQTESTTAKPAKGIIKKNKCYEEEVPRARIRPVVLGLSAYTGYRTYDTYHEVSESDLLLANAEALATDDEGGGGLSQCQGPQLYDEVGTSVGEKVVRTHWGYGLDFVQTFKLYRCYAIGNGNLGGQNYIYETEPVSSEYKACEGNQYHNSLLD